MTALSEMSVVELARRVRAGELSPLEILDAHIARIESVNPELNAVVADRFERAREEARAAGERLVNGGDEIGPLHGIPCTIKEFIGVEGMPQTGGIMARRHERAEVDATIVRRLRDAGAIVLGVTNVPEGGMSAETHNNVYGRTVNPWNPKRTCGGSSGGEGAIIAAGGSPFGIGSDIAGSVRIPAAFCGIASHKPTGRMVPTTGHEPRPDGELGAFLCCGPMGRSVEDLAVVLDVIRGADGRDSLVTESAPVGEEALAEPVDDIDLSDVTVFPVPSQRFVRVGLEARQAVTDAARTLENRGAQVDTSLASAIQSVFSIWTGMMLELGGDERYADVLRDDGQFRILPELWRVARGRSAHTLGVFPMLVAEALGDLLPVDTARLTAAGRRLRARLEDALGDDGVLLHPTWTGPAPRHNATLLTPFRFVCTAVFSVLEMPASQVPMGFFSDGLPRGVQIAASRGRDGLTLRVARALEADTGGWQRAPVSD